MTKDLTNEESKKEHGKPWPVHSSQHGLIEELLQAGIPVGLTYTVTIKDDHPNE